ncbi:MAG: hypothetical protein DRN20_04315 [Thermoplasmata archaeon]|nr:MAG: hypothetical protein DRN20_04315 [Thermoplasmata archaeon]
MFYPKSVAVIGASATPRKIGHEILKSLLKFKGRVYAVNPNYDEILGIKCYPSVLNIPASIDLCVIALPAQKVPSALVECGKKGIRYAVIVSGGFKEIGDVGAKLEREITSIGKKFGIRIIGPNCIGIANPKIGLYTFFQPEDFMERPAEGAISVMTQSGTVGCIILEFLAYTGIGLAKFVSYGNKCDIDEYDVISALKNDNDTRILVGYIESFDNPNVLSAMKEFCKNKYMIVVKGGRTKEGTSAVKSHTGALAEDYRVFRGVIKQHGGIVVDSIDELKYSLKIVNFYYELIEKFNGKIVIITNGAGLSVITVDSIANSKYLSLASVDKKLRSSLPEYAILSNPLDLTGSATGEDFARAIMGVSETSDGGTAIILNMVLQDAPLGGSWQTMISAIKQCMEKTMILACADGGEFTMGVTRDFEALGVPVFSNPVLLISALDKVYENVRWKRYEKTGRD